MKKDGLAEGSPVTHDAGANKAISLDASASTWAAVSAVHGSIIRIIGRVSALHAVSL
jgi:hypothetical protein